jgi:tetratricopeptide (TPR) repeat protein
VIDRLLIGRRWRSIFRSVALWLVLTVPIMVIARLVQSGHDVDGGPHWARPLLTLDSLAFYLGKLVWPAMLTPDYGHRPAAVLARGELWWTWIFPAALLAIAIWQRRRRRWFAAACLVFVLGTLPTLGEVPFSFEFFSTTADHYLYVSMLGVAMIAAYAIATSPHRRAWIAGAAVVLLALAARSFAQTPHWADNRALLTHMIDAGPDNFTGYYLLGQAEVDAGHYTAAEPLLRKAIAIEPRFPKPHDALATVLLHTGRAEEAIEHIKVFIRSASDASPSIRAELADARVTLGLYYFKHGQYTRAADEFRAALKMRPNDPTLMKLLKQAEE